MKLWYELFFQKKKKKKEHAHKHTFPPFSFKVLFFYPFPYKKKWFKWFLQKTAELFDWLNSHYLIWISSVGPARGDRGTPPKVRELIFPELLYDKHNTKDVY